MAKRKKKAKKRRPSGTRAQVLRKEQISIVKEAGYIVKLAQRGDARVVTIGGLIFFSTSGGDAWVLDPEDNLALCLAEDGEQLPCQIVETDERFVIRWNVHYAIDRGEFLVQDQTGSVRAFLGYPVDAILDGETRASI